MIPNEFWGDGETRSHNKSKILLKIDHFVKLRRFETMSLHEISQNLKIWKHIAEPSMANLKEGMFEEVKLDDALRTLQSRRLGFSQIRLLPKGDKLRPITNLRRRVLTQGANKLLGPSINSILGPVHTLLKLEKASED
ncbi:Telomerase reverse transcriptase [Neonectria punicea]|uniref:Telomerase reverse transcriptase n=1 Tax=Neonectria punicea TaxID=979145 RepID=A0ABR1H4K4_9HYPO